MFCKHDFELVNQFIVDSEFETVINNGKTPTTDHSIVKKYLTDYCCKKCGKLKRFIEKTHKD